ncbi:MULTISPECIES: dolichyl-phosphate-mannose--protein mannosyltransferase [unclassified Kitasatospora]|uniref:dolichyl-phosphate-mannose--protein mannosyltransferase n=1 Tax=unclassified Kitasatospora TaxID=2633591 RepID=UPI0009EB3343|nr:MULTISPECIES: phospholipid carrier-dependent glycosyltransferase [unclassified Kitasatospora]
MWRVSGEKGLEGPVGVDHSERGGAVLPDEAAPVPGPRPAEPERPSRRGGLERFGYRMPERAGTAERLVPPMPDGPGVTPRRVPPSPVLLRLGLRLPDALWSWLCRWAGWLGPLAVALFAGALRFSGLGGPHSMIFDETYYAKDAYSLWQVGYETNWPDDSNGRILSPEQSIPFRPDPSYIVHPPVGKWMIGLGEQWFGMNPFGWRFAVAVLGTLSVLMIARIGRRLFRSTLLGSVAGLLLAVDGLHFVMSRSALLDLVVMFWCLAAFGFLLLDRDRTRGLVARRLEQGEPNGGWWLVLGWRPYRLAAVVCIGLTLATKWSGAYILGAFILLSVCWDFGTRRLAGIRFPLLYAISDCLLAGFLLVPVAIVVYVASWTGWFMSSTEPGKGGYGRDWALHREGLSPEYVSGIRMPFQVDLTWVPDALRSLWHYHATMWDFHVGLTSAHTYQSNPWSWLLVGRPVSFFYESPKMGQSGCKVNECAAEVLGIGTPLLWWTGLVALLYCLYRWVLRRDWRAGAILCGLAAGYLPWFMYQQRTIFLFYAVIFVPFLVLAVTMMLGALIGPVTASRDRRMIGGTAAGLLVLLVMWNFLYFLPIYTGQTIPMDDWRARMWFNSWI